MVRQGGPARGCVAEREPFIAGEVGAEPSDEVGRRPRIAEVGSEEGSGLIVEREKAPPIDAMRVVQLGLADCVLGVGGMSGSVLGRPEVIRVVGFRTFVLRDGVWIETTFDPSTMKTTEVPFASEEYFALLDERPDLAPAFALGDRVIALSGGVAYEVTA